MISFDDVVEILHLAVFQIFTVFAVRTQLGKRSGIGWCFFGVDDAGLLLTLQPSQGRAIPLSGKGVTGACSAAHFGEHFLSECQAGPRGAAVDPAAGKPAPVAGTRSRQKNGPASQGLAEKPLGRPGIPGWQEVEFNRDAEFIDRTMIELGPFSTNLDIGLVNAPTGRA